MAFAWQTMTMPFVAGLNTSSDARALQAPELTICRDVQFDEVGGLQTRHPFAAQGSNILAGSTIANARQVVPFGDEWLLFTKDALYSWSAQLSKWVLKGTHLAAQLTEGSRFVNPVDQVNCDRAELSGTIVYAWAQASRVFVAAMDKVTGAVVMTPTEIAGDNRDRPRLVALTTKILLFMNNLATVNLDVLAIDPANVAAGVAAATTALGASVSNDYYDACQVIGADTAAVVQRENPTTHYTVLTVTAALVVTSASKVRDCTGPIAVSSSPTGTQLQVVRVNGTNIQGDLLTTSSLADVYTAQAIGTATGTNQIACAHRSTTDSSQYRCYVFWSYGEGADTSVSFGTKYNWVDTGNTLGTQGDFVDHVGIASRAFEREGHVYVWIAFAAASIVTVAAGATTQVMGLLQNTYFLYRDDVFPVAKAANGIAGGYSASTGHLPGVALTATNMYSWCGVERRAIALGSNLSGYSARAPRDITVEFDSNAARRCARLGETLYIAGGEILQYDGQQLVEVGFHLYPWMLDLTDWAAGNLAAGAYAYKMTWRWDNAKGERDRSTTATSGLITMGANRETSVIPWNASNVTHKTVSPCAAELWRTAVAPTPDAPYYLASSSDPTATSNPNRYLANDPSSMALAVIIDSYADATLTTKETNPENGAVLENLAPPAASIIVANDARLFLAGVSGDPHRIWYSKLRNAGEVASFHDALTVSIPLAGGDITALSFLNETLVVFREKAIYMVPGDGFDNLGGGQNYGPSRVLSIDCGAVSAEAVAITERGLVFKSSKGWYLLDRSWSLQYIGGPVADFDSDTVVAVHALEGQNQIRCLSTARMLVLDTLVNQWSEWTIDDGVHAAIWQGAYGYLTATGVKLEQDDYTGVDYGIDVETAWIKLANLQGFGAVKRLMVLGEYRSAHKLRIRVARDYDDTYYDDKSWPPSPTTVGGREQVRHDPSRPRCEAIKIRLTAVSAAATFATLAISKSSEVYGSSTLTLTAIVAGDAGNVSIANNAGAGPNPPTVADVAGVVTLSSTSSSTFAQVASAINTSSALVTAAVTGNEDQPFPWAQFTGALAGGTDWPTGDALKLTGLDLELGLERGLYKRLPVAQKQ